MPGTFRTALEAATANLTIKIDEQPLLSPAERQCIVFDWNRTAGDYPADDCLPDAFSRHAIRSPNAPALIVGEKTITYCQLLDRANRLAHFLKARGIKPGDFVGVCLRRSTDMIAAVLAITKIGAAYVPLDPGYPRERLSFMLEDSRATIVLSQWALLDRLSSLADRVLNVEQIGAELARQPNTDPERGHTPDAVAYVIYTSGSTGKPKGVIVRHRAAINTIDWVNQTFGIGSSDRLLFVTSLSFDLSVYDIFGVLGAGGCLRLADEHELKDPSKLAELLQTAGITLWNSAPAALQQLAPFLDPSRPSSNLRTVLLSGDWIPVTLPGEVRASFPNARVMALGGATEAAIWSNWFPVTKVDPNWTSIPYGKPIRNAHYHVLDIRLEPVPVGSSGELYIGGLCLADGYWQRPELTAERFICDPFRPGERLYKTGDLARYLPDGNIEFLGRIDLQVKIRGFRVELGEIETALTQHPSVREAVVKPFRDEEGNVCLTGFIVRKNLVEGIALANHLRVGLPDYMVPANFVFLETLPITPNGKVDRAALLQPAFSTASVQSDYSAPINDAELGVQRIWEEVLHVHPVSVTTRFEELGGHSLMAAQIVSRIETRLGHKLPLEALFHAATIREQATLIERKLEIGTGSLVPLNEEGSHHPLFLIAGAGGHVFTFHKFSRCLGSEYPAYGMKAIGVDGSEPPLDRVEEIASRYLDEIVRVRPKGPYVVSGYSVGGLMAFELALQMQRRGLEVAKVIALDTFAPGYPKRLSWPTRLGIHIANFLTRPGERKWAYLAHRFRNLRHRLLTMAGKNHLDLPDAPKIGGVSEMVLKKVWAALERARIHYWPERKFDGQIVLVRSEAPEHWAATRLDDPLNGWARWTTQPVQVMGTPARHMELFSDESLDVLVKQIREAIKFERKKSTRPSSRETAALP